MLSRGGLSVVSVMALLIVVGLLLTHSKEASTVGNTFFNGIDLLVQDIELTPRKTRL